MRAQCFRKAFVPERWAAEVVQGIFYMEYEQWKTSEGILHGKVAGGGLPQCICTGKVTSGSVPEGI